MVKLPFSSHIILIKVKNMKTQWRRNGGGGGGAMSPHKELWGGNTCILPPPPHKDIVRDIQKIINVNFKSNFSIALEISRLFDNFEIFLKNYDLKYSIFVTFFNFEKNIRKN